MTQAAMSQEIQHNEALRQAHEERKYEMGTKQAALAKMQASPGWAQMPAWQQSQMQLWASTPGSSIPNMMSSSMMRPVRLSTSPSSAHKPESLLDEDNQLIDPAKAPFVTEFEDRYTGRRFFVPGTGAYTQITEPWLGLGSFPVSLVRLRQRMEAPRSRSRRRRIRRSPWGTVEQALRPWLTRRLAKPLLLRAV
jgi:hypothetical protein